MGIQVTLTTHTHAAEMKNHGKDPNPAHFFLGNKNIQTLWTVNDLIFVISFMI